MAQDKQVTWPGGFGAELKRTDADSELLRQYRELEASRAAEEQAAVARYRQLEAERGSKLAAPTIGEKVAYAGKSFARGVVESAASTLTGMGMMGGGLARLGGETPPQLAITPQQFAEGQQRFAQQYAPDRDPRFAGSLWESVPEAFGSTVPFAVGGAAGGAPVISALGAAAQFSSGYYDALAETGDPEKAFEAGWKNSPAGLLEAVPLGGQVARFLGRANKATGGSLGKAMVTALVEGSENAAQEVVQRGWQDSVAKYVMEYDTDREMLVDALRQEALPAFLVGAVLGGLSQIGQLPPDVAEKYGVPPTPPQEPAAPTQPQEGSQGSLELPTQQAASQEAVEPQGVPPPIAELAGQMPEAGQPLGRTQVAEVAPAVAQQAVTSDKAADTGSTVPTPAPTGETQATTVPTQAAPTVAEVSPTVAGDSRTTVPPTVPPQADAVPPRKTTGIKNDTVERELEAMGMPMPPKGERTTFVEAHARAKEAFAADPLAGARLMSELEVTNRPPTASEDALLTFEVNRLINERDAAQEAFNANPTPENQKRIDDAVGAYAKAAQVVQAAGSESGRSLAFRRMMMARDYSLAALERRAKVANAGFDLPAEQKAEIVKLAAEMKALQDKLAKVQEEAELRKATMEAEIAFLRMQKGANKGRKRVERTKRIEESKARIKSLESELATLMRGQANVGLDPNAVTLIFKLAAEYARFGSLTFAQWSTAMVEKHGPAVQPHLDPAWKQAQQMLRDERGVKLRERSQAGRPLTSQRPMILKLAEGFVEDGIADRDKLVDAVHEVVKSAYPEATRRQVMDAISGYGEFKTLSDDEVKRQLRDIRGQLQQVAKLEDLQAKLAPKKTGMERRAPSKEERRLIQQVNEAKRRANIKETGPDTLKTVEESMRTRLQNQIDDLQYQIDNKTQIVRDRTKTQPSAEVMALRAKRDALRQEFDALFPKDIGPLPNPEVDRLNERIAEVEKQIADGGKVDPKRAKQGPPIEQVAQLQERLRGLKEELGRVQEQAKQPKPDPAIAKLEESIAELEQRIKEGGAPAKPRAERQGPPTEPVFKLRKQREELQRQMAEMRRKDPATIRLEAAKRAVEKSIAEYERRIAAGETAAKQRQPGPSTAELDALRARRDALRAELDEMRPRASQEERDLAAFKRRKLNEIARLKERAFYGEFEDPRPSKREPKELVLDEEAIKLKAEEAAVKRKIEAQIAKFEYENRTRAQELRDAGLEALRLQKQLVSSYDLGALLRQGAIPSTAHPFIMMRRWVPRMIRSVRSAENVDDQMARLKAHPLYPQFEKYGGKLPDPNGEHSQREEYVRSKLADRIPGVNASNRAFMVLNHMRMDLFVKMYEAFPHTPSAEEVTGLVNAVHAATGIGDAGKGRFASFMKAAKEVLWAPDLLLSRIQLLTLRPIRRAGSRTAQKIIAKELARSLAGLAAFYILAHLYGALQDDEEVSVEWDPRSTRVGKVTIGDSTVDPLGGLSQVIALLGRVISGETKKTDGEVVPNEWRDEWDIFIQFIRTKLHPTWGLAVNLRTGEDPTGANFSGVDAAKNMVLPISVRDTIDAIKAHGFVEGSALSLLAILGMGLNTHETPEQRAERERPGR